MIIAVFNLHFFLRHLAVIVFTLMLLTVTPLHAADTDVNATLVARITQSKSELLKIQQDIAKQSSALAKTMSAQQQSIKGLREKASTLQRVADERLLSLEKLQERVKKWSSQSQYQHQLLSSYVESTNLMTPEQTPLDSINVAVVNLAYKDIGKKLNPQWQLKDVVTPNGKFQTADVLQLGPVEVALDNDNNLAGLIIRETAGEPRLLLGAYDDRALQQLKSLKSHNSGLITFDPTLGNANKLLTQNKGILSHVETGGVWAIPILIFAALSFVVSLLKAFQLISLPRITPLLAERVAALSVSTDISTDERQKQISEVIQQAKGAQQQLLEIAKTTPVSQQRDDYLVAYLLEYKHRIEKYLGAIATSAAIAPLLGLLGTVSGMISTFKMMKIFGTGDASTVSGGISEALITTELGLVVAIPSLIVSALLSRKIKSYHAQLEGMAIKLSRIEFPTKAAPDGAN